MGDNLLGKLLAPAASVRTMLGKCFATNPFGKDEVIKANNESGKFNIDSGEEGREQEVIETKDLPILCPPILGESLYLGNNKSGFRCLTITDLQRLSKDASALCQYVYMDDGLRPPESTNYCTATHQDSNGRDGWISFRHLQEYDNSSVESSQYIGLNELYKKLNDYFPKNKTYLVRRRTGFNSDIYIYIKEEKVRMLAYVTGGSRPFTSIQTKEGSFWGGA